MKGHKICFYGKRNGSDEWSQDMFLLRNKKIIFELS